MVDDNFNKSHNNSSTHHLIQPMIKSTQHFHTHSHTNHISNSFLKKLKHKICYYSYLFKSIVNDNLSEIITQVRCHKQSSEGKEKKKEGEWEGLLKDKQNHEMLISL